MQGPFSEYTGRGVSVAMIDSGVNPGHPHVGGVAGGVRISADGTESEDYLDYNGHGTAVAGAIREKAPGVLLYAVKVFDRNLTTRIEAIIRAIEWAVEREMMIINLSLGTKNEAHRERLERVVERAARDNRVIVSACRELAQSDAGGSNQHKPLLPGCLPQVIGVDADWECPRETYRVAWIGGDPAFAASVYPREIPGVPRERNLCGISFAVANMTGFVARAREANSDRGVLALKGFLIESALRNDNIGAA